MTQIISPGIPPDTSIVSKVVADINWVKTHVILLVLTACLALGAVYGVESIISKHDDAAATRWEQVVASDRDTLRTLQNQLQTNEENRQRQIDALIAQNNQLAQTISTRQQQTQVQVKKDATLTAQEAAQRLTQQTKAAPGEVTAAGDTVVLDLPISRTVVSQLDILPAAQADVVDTQKELANETAMYQASQTDVAELKKIITAQNKEGADAAAASKAEIKALKAKHRKQMLKFGAICYGAGVASGLLLHHFVPAL